MYKHDHTESIKNKADYFSTQARALINWDRPFTIAYQDQQWFSDGYLNACYNLIDRHCSTSPHKTAIIYETNEGETVKYTYLQCQQEIMKVANYMKHRLGDEKVCVAIYMPTSDQLLFTVLACARLGLPHNVIFGGFTAESICMRVKDSNAKIMFTVDKARREKKVLDFYANVIVACHRLKKENYDLECLVVYDKDELSLESVVEIVLWNDVLKGEIYEHDELRISKPKKIKTSDDKNSVVLEQKKETKSEGKIEIEMEKVTRQRCKLDLTAFIPCVSVKSEHELFYLYTSGSTGKPKGLVHTTGGYLTYAALTTQKVFDVKTDDVFCSTADIGWITGHTYSIYGPLALGCTVVIFGGIPTFPSSTRSFEAIEKYKITHFYTAPTVIRMLKKNLGAVKAEFRQPKNSDKNNNEDKNAKTDDMILKDNTDVNVKDNTDENVKDNNDLNGKILSEKNVNEKDINKLDDNQQGVKLRDVKTLRDIKDVKNVNVENIKDLKVKYEKDINEKVSNVRNTITNAFMEEKVNENVKTPNKEENVQDSQLERLPENMLSKQHKMSFEEMMRYEPSSFYRANDNFYAEDYNLSSLRIIGTVGEPINREAYFWYKNTFGPYLPLVDTYWQTESGGIMISAIPYMTYPVPECACVPFYGMQPKIMGDGELGALVFEGPWPGIARTVINDHERYINAYFSKYKGCYYTGDEGYMKNGYFFVRGREDDVLNVAGHRMSTAEIESACCSNDSVVEAAAVGVRDAITGQAIVLFCVKRSGKDEVVSEYVKHTLRDKIGPIVKIKKVYIVSEVPKTRTGKIMRRVLRDIIEGREVGDLSTCNNVEAVELIKQRIWGVCDDITVEGSIDAL